MKTKSLRIASTNGMSREEWLNLRRHGIGGSDAAAIVGLNSFSSPFSVWADKCGKLPPKETTEAMRLGTDLEEYVSQRFEEKSGLKVRRVNAILQNQKYEFALANVDREVVGMEAGLECKTTNAFNTAKFHGVDFPENYYAQCIHYMAVTGCPTWYCAVLVLGVEFKIFRITMIEDEEVPEWCDGSVLIDQAEIDALMEAEKAFWDRYIVGNEIPPADGDPATSTVIKTMYVGGEQDVLDLPVGHIAESLSQVRAQIKVLETEEERLTQEIQLQMGDAEHAVCDGYKIDWATRSRAGSLDTKALAADHPEIPLDAYRKPGSIYRTFTLKATKKKESA